MTYQELGQALRTCNALYHVVSDPDTRVALERRKEWLIKESGYVSEADYLSKGGLHESIR